MQVRDQDAAAISTQVASETDPMLALASARSAEQFCLAWLGVLCSLSPVRVGLLLLQDTDGSYVPAAMWPPESDPEHLADPARDALGQRRGIIKRAEDGGILFAYPLLVSENLIGVVVLDWAQADDALVAQTTRHLHWGEGWLNDLFNRRTLGEQQAQAQRSAFLVDLTLGALAENEAKKAGLTVVNRLAQHFGCHQVLLGVEKGKTVTVNAMSQAAWFDDRANLVNLAAQAMNEAFDQRARVIFPEPDDQAAVLISAAHRRYAQESASAVVLSQPVEHAGQVVAVWLLERDQPFQAAELLELEALSQALAPVLEVRREQQESLPAHALRAWKGLLRKLTDTSRPGLKLGAVVVAVVLVLLAVIDVDYRISARAAIEGAVQRAAVAPFQGYIREAPIRAGDTVKQGQVLAVLEDRDLKLEQVRWESEQEVAVRKEREAMAHNDRVALRLASAQANQARAQLELVNEKLARVQISAPFDGVVVKGDLSQQLGSPVEQGKVLFELAPLDAWRVILKVDERDIADLHLGKAGELVLTSLPGRSYPLTVSKVTPVSVAEDGRNYFRIEAELPQNATGIRPGMEGIAKVEAADRSLLWIWTHRFTDWLRLTLWQWSP